MPICHGAQSDRVSSAGGGNFRCPIPGPASAAPQDDALAEFEDDLSRTIVDCEVNSSAWTLMHRYNKATELIDSVLNVSGSAVACLPTPWHACMNFTKTVYSLVILFLDECSRYSALSAHNLLHFLDHAHDWYSVHFSLKLGCSQTSSALSVLHKMSLDAQGSKLHDNARHVKQGLTLCHHALLRHACREAQRMWRVPWPPSLCGCATAQLAT